MRSNRGLHANFKIAKSGEVLFLLDPSQKIIDEIAFGPQTTDISFGRYPNGTGEFAFMDHSFNNNNNVPLTSLSTTNEITNKFYLSQNYPNPFNPSTTISYQVPDHRQCTAATSEVQRVTLVVYDILGRKVRTLVNGIQKPGNYTIEFDASELNSGIYFYKLQSNDNVQYKKMVYLK